MSVTELRELGVIEMDEDAIGEFLSSQGVGILGLPTDEGLPYLLPMSYGFDGESTLYFSYLLGEHSRKQELSERHERARFLVYRAASKFSWESVMLRGSLARVPESDWAAIDEYMRNAWHPDVFESAALSGGVSIYRFDVEESVGYKQTGLPPGFDRLE